MVEYARDSNWLFISDFESLFPDHEYKFFGGLKTNLSRIADNFRNNDIDADDEKKFRLTDLLRITLRLEDEDESIQAFNKIN